MDPHIELQLLNYRLRIMTVKKPFINKLMFAICRISFTNKTKCSFFSFTETNDDYSLIVDEYGFEELMPFINEKEEVVISDSRWIPCSLSGDDLPGSMSISKIAKFIILPLADCAISIMAISMYQCDYILFQEKDYEVVIKCLSSHMKKIQDESLDHENEIVFMRRNNKKLWSNAFTEKYQSQARQKKQSQSSASNEEGDSSTNARHITLPLIIPDLIDYCITGFYNERDFQMIIPTLLDIMFYETENYEENEIFFNFTKKDSDISLVLETRLVKKFPIDTLHNVDNDFWKLVRIGQLSVSLEIFGVCAFISHPLEIANIDEYYISSYHTGYCFIPADKLKIAKELFAKRKAKILTSNKNNTISNITSSNVELSNPVEIKNELFIASAATPACIEETRAEAAAAKSPIAASNVSADSYYINANGEYMVGNYDDQDQNSEDEDDDDIIESFGLNGSPSGDSSSFYMRNKLLELNANSSSINSNNNNASIFSADEFVSSFSSATGVTGIAAYLEQ